MLRAELAFRQCLHDRWFTRSRRRARVDGAHRSAREWTR